MSSEQHNSYQRLPGRGYGTSNLVTRLRYRLWLGDDHLLAVESAFCTETYKRFYFREVQAVYVQPTRGQLATCITVMALALGCAVGVTFLGIEELRWLTAAAMVFFLVWLGVELLRGPTVKLRMQTAVQIEWIRSVTRLRQARRLLRRIEPLILAAQPAPVDTE